MAMDPYYIRRMLEQLSIFESVQGMLEVQKQAVEQAGIFESAQMVLERHQQEMRETQMSMAERYTKMLADQQKALSDAQTGMAHKVIQESSIAEQGGRMAEQATRAFSALSIDEAVAGAIQRSLQQVSHPIIEANASSVRAAADQAINLIDSSDFRSVSDNAIARLTESISPDALAAARYLATTTFLQDTWLRPDTQATLRSTLETV